MTDPLCGTYNPSIDQKGRMSFPNKLREILGAEFYLCPGHDGHYISVYSTENYQEYKSKLYTIPGKPGDNLRRLLISGADRQIPDKQGRIFITQALRDHAEITDEVVVIGSGNRAEIWSRANWEEFQNSVSIEDFSDVLADLVL